MLILINQFANWRNNMQAQSIFQKLKGKAAEKSNQKVDEKTDKAATVLVNAPENEVKSDEASGINNASTSNANGANN